MCGICGIVFSDHTQPVDPGLIRRMADVIRHRGPDGEGYHIAPGVGLGFRRLGIVDLKTGDQPLYNEDRSVALLCNGEIYNAPELRAELEARGHVFRSASDAEPILHLYEDRGEECLAGLRGMFGFALWDARRRRLMLARDRLGIKPVHYAVMPGALSFASEQKSVLMSGQFEPRIDAKALCDLLTLGFVRGPKTLFPGIRRLQPGHYLIFQDGKISVRCYWEPSFPSQDEPSPRLRPREWAELLLDKLRDSVRVHLMSDVPVGAWLSAGIDSSVVAGIISRISDNPVKTFTLGFEATQFDEISLQKTLDQYPAYRLSNERTICRKSDLDLLPLAVWHSEDPVPTFLDILRMKLSEMSSRHVKVVLSGEGSDEVLCGYPWFVRDKVERSLSGLPLVWRILVLLRPFIPAWKRWLRASPPGPCEMNLERYKDLLGFPRRKGIQNLLSRSMKSALAMAGEPDEDFSLPALFGSWHPLNQLQYMEMKIRLPDYINHTLDRGSMAYSLEARVPFMDAEVVEFCSRMPAALKIRGLQEKYILRRAAAGLLPGPIRRRKKRGLAAPIGQWLTAPLPEFAVELLSGGSLRSKGYFNPLTVERLLRKHQAGQAHHGPTLAAVLAVQLWDEIFLRGFRPEGVKSTI
jgi:asparagine synthase (glutamine-hydrolysing)